MGHEGGSTLKDNALTVRGLLIENAVRRFGTARERRRRSFRAQERVVALAVVRMASDGIDDGLESRRAARRVTVGWIRKRAPGSGTGNEHERTRGPIERVKPGVRCGL